jgi:hypothetical protein
MNKGQAGEFAEQLKSLFTDLWQMLGLQKQLEENRSKAKVGEVEDTREINQGINDQTSAVERATSAVGRLASAWGDVMRQVAQTNVNTEALASMSSPAQVQRAAAGGKAWEFLAGGGQPLGSDTIPAMLSPGEFVMNAASSQRFASQLLAMNAGIKPVFRSEGGSVTNIGDINVTVTGGGSSRQTARSIATELRRELRRGTSTL